jgi:hypothetical protein
MAPDWATGGRIVAAVDEGLVVSTDGGYAWRPVQGGPEYPYVIAPCEDELLVGAYGQGVYRSRAGETWALSNGDLAAHLPPVVGFSDAFDQDRTLYMASMEGVLVRSADGGETWDQVLGEEDGNLSTFVCAGAGDAITVLAAAGSTMLRSPDGGASWAASLNTGQDPLTALAVSDSYAQDRIAVAGTNGGQIWASRDEGASWHRVGSLGGTVVSLAAHTGANGLAVYVVTAQATEEGAWQLNLYVGGTGKPLLTRSSGEPVAALRLLEGGDLLCAMGQQVLYLEENEPVAENELEGSAAVSCLGVAGDVLLAASRQGVYRSADRGRSWDWLTSDISAVAMRVTSPERVYVVSMGGRLWQVDLP